MTVACALAGWALCGGAMYGALAFTTADRALVIHALAAPLIFAAIAIFYFRRPGSWSPAAAAATFLGTVVTMDVLIVALLVEKSFDMFRSVRGSWLPFTLIFASTWWTGRAVRRAASNAGRQEASG
jgi:hypothetical protein